MDSFVTGRLRAERLDPRHLDDLVALHLDEYVSRFLGGVRQPDDTAAYLAVNLAHWDRHGFGLWVLRDLDGTFAGRAGIRHVRVDGAGEIEIAYTFAKPFWGQGLATEITAALVAIAFDDLALPGLVGIVDVDHPASRRVMEKSGFALEKITRYDTAEVAVYRQLRP